MSKRTINITGKEGLSPSSRATTKSVSTSFSPSSSASPSPAPDDDVTSTYDVINKMVDDGVIRNYALGGAMAAFFYIEPSTTADIDMFCALAHEPLASGLVLLTPITDYLKNKGFETTALGAIIHGFEVQFQFPDQYCPVKRF